MNGLFLSLYNRALLNVIFRIKIINAGVIGGILGLGYEVN